MKPERDEAAVLQEYGIKPSAQRVAVAQFLLHTKAHPSADEVWQHVRQNFPQISRATVYNTLNLFVERKLIRQFNLTEGRLVFDPNLNPHHHFVDEDSGEISDIPWDALEVSKVSELQGFDVSEYQVVLRGKRNAS